MAEGLVDNRGPEFGPPTEIEAARCAIESDQKSFENIKAQDGSTTIANLFELVRRLEEDELELSRLGDSDAGTGSDSC
ncbi:MAG: hypothetical protein ABI220_01170 [Candidatus Saccharimonadales bacterium]